MSKFKKSYLPGLKIKKTILQTEVELTQKTDRVINGEG